MPTESNGLDAAIDKAYNSLSGDGPEGGGDAVETGSDAGASNDVAALTGESDATLAPTTDKASVAPPPETGRSRDTTGRFAPKTGTSRAAPTDRAGKTSATVKPTLGAPSSTEPGKDLRPPPSYSPAAREAWANVPKEVQADIWRREKEANQAMQGAAESRQHQQWYQTTVSPYEGLFRAEGVDSRTGIGNLVQAMAVLHGPNPVAKAQLWATVAKTYGLDPDLITQAYNNQAGQGGNMAPPQPQMDPRSIAQQAGQYALQQLQQARGQQMVEQAHVEVDQHAQKLEFFEDLRPTMAVILEAATAQKQAMDIPTAYKLAMGMRPDLQGIMTQRQAAQAARSPSASVQRAKLAGSSIRGAPSPAIPPGQRKNGLDGAIDAAWDSVVRRGDVG